MQTIDHMLAVRERSLFTNPSASREMMFEVIRASTDELERRADFQAIIHDILIGAIPRTACRPGRVRVVHADFAWSWLLIGYVLVMTGSSDRIARPGRPVGPFEQV
jgi:hypothetical protein